jgi:L-iditol 2-dehydrogenase
MWAAVLHAVGDLRVERRPRPRPGAGQALLRVRAAGICGSDVPRVFEHGTYRFPLIPGHEFAGEVAEVGAGVSSWKAGDRAAVYPLIPCRSCPSCRRKRFELCDSYDYLGSRSDGGFAEYVLAPAENLVPLPEGVGFEAAAMTEPAAVALHGLRRVGLAPGEEVAVFGAGPVGLFVAQIARGLGAGRVFVIDVVERKLEVARSLRFEEVVNGGGLDVPEQVRGRTGSQGVRLAVEAAGAPAALHQALAVCGKEGRLLWLGNPSGEVELAQKEISSLLRRELRLVGTWNSSIVGPHSDWEVVLGMMARGELETAPLVTHRFPVSAAPEAFARMREGKEFFHKVLFVFE